MRCARGQRDALIALFGVAGAQAYYAKILVVVLLIQQNFFPLIVACILHLNYVQILREKAT